MRRRSLMACLAVAALGATTGCAPSGRAPTSAPGPPSGAGTRLHYIANLHGQGTKAARLGYNLLDTGSDRSDIDALPAHARALVWLGGLDDSAHSCANPGYSWSQFTAAVDALASNPRVYGYFLSDEPQPEICPSAVADIRGRADYIREHDPRHKSFIVVLDGTYRCHGTYGCEYSALRPQYTHVDLIGVDVYPCTISDGCDVSKIDARVAVAEKSGIPPPTIVPVIGIFGNSCSARGHYYQMPTVAELDTILARWEQLVPAPAFDFTYTWGHQSDACPTLVDANGHHGYPDLQSVMRAHNTS